MIVIITNIVIQLRDVALFSNSLLTVDLKSGSKVNIGTHTITLEKFFEGKHITMATLSCRESYIEHFYNIGN